MIIRNQHNCEGVDFITPSEYSQQVAYMHHPAGKIIDAHVHNLVHRNVLMTQEVLFIKSGKLRVDFYDVDGQLYCGEITLHHGSGFDRFYPEKYDYEYGALIKLN